MGEDIHINVVSKLYDSVLKLTIAVWTITEAASSVHIVIFGGTHFKVAHVLTITLRAHLHVHIAIELRDLRWVDATFVMQTIDVHTDQMLKLVAVHQLH